MNPARIAERIASDLVRRAGQGAPPVDPRSVAQLLCPGLRIAEHDIDGAGYLFPLFPSGGEVLVRRSDPEWRQRFTIAHELGHWYLLHVAPEDLYESCDLGTRNAMERWCNAFAAALLMPDGWLLRDLSRAGPARFAEFVQFLPGRYGVSRQTARIRVSTSTPISIFVLRRVANYWELEEKYLAHRADDGDALRATFAYLKQHANPRESLPAVTRYSDSVAAFKLLGLGSEGEEWLAAVAPLSFMLSVHRGVTSGPGNGWRTHSDCQIVDGLQYSEAD
ncbi:MAG: ImmA/IrrE family metallo-endopeptidase [Gemmatimonadaceae bacterium]